MGGLFLVVLIPQNLVYLGVPVRISGWLLLGAALLQVWLFRQKLVAGIQTFYSNREMRTLAVVVLLTVTFHGIVPIQQGLEWYYGKGYDDQLNYVLLAEFLKEEPYSTRQQDIGLRPWLVKPVGFQVSAEQLGLNSGPGIEVTGFKKERIGQSIITAEISVWSGIDGKGGYAATVIFFLTVLAICLYVLLREIAIDRFLAGSGALLAVFLPAVTRLSLDGFLSQVSILFVFPFFAIQLRHQELSARSFTLFFSLTVAYFVSAYSEIAPLGLGTLCLGVMFIRGDTIRSKRFMLMGAMLLIALVNPYYLRNLIEFLGQQYYTATNTAFLDRLAPSLRTLHGWSELLFGGIASASFAVFFDYCTLLAGLLVMVGAIILSKCDRLVFGAILLPASCVILYLATRLPPSYYPMAKITLSILPVVVGLLFVVLSRIGAHSRHRSVGVLKSLLCAMIVAGSAAGSVRYYSEVFQNEGFLSSLRETRFQNVCRELEEIRNKRVLVFENHPWLTPWLCYHARHNDVYFDGRFINDASIPQLFSFLKFPNLADVDFVATRDRIVDLRDPSVSCLTLVDDTPGEDRTDNRDRYWLGPPARLRFVALRPMSANLKIQLAPGPEATTFPVDYFLTDAQGHVLQGQLWRKSVEVLRINLPKGLSYLELSVKAKVSGSNAAPSFPTLAELDGIEISNVDDR